MKPVPFCKQMFLIDIVLPEPIGLLHDHMTYHLFSSLAWCGLPSIPFLLHNSSLVPFLHQQLSSPCQVLSLVLSSFTCTFHPFPSLVILYLLICYELLPWPFLKALFLPNTRYPPNMQWSILQLANCITRKDKNFLRGPYS